MHLVICIVKIVEIRVLDHSEIDIEKWESCVSNSLNVCIFAHCWYLDTLTFGWEALVMDDYDAVMPYFTDGNKACLKFGVAWTGIYSQKELTMEVCQHFLNVLDRRFRKIDLVFDKFFLVPDTGLRGLFSKETVHQVDTINPPYELSSSSQMLDMAEAAFPKDFVPILRLREYVPQSITRLLCEHFMKLDRRLGIRSALKLKALAERSVSKKFGYYLELSKDETNTHAAILVTFCNHYIFVPYIKCKGMSEAYGQYVMLLDLLRKHFVHSPGILVLDDARLNISPLVLRLLRAEAFSIYRYRAGMEVSIRKFIRTKLLKKYNNTL